MINSVCGIRSTGRICTDLADALSQKGHKVKIAYGRETVPDQYKSYAVRIGNDLSVKIHGLQSRLFDNTGFGSKEATKKFLRWADTFDPDILHLHNLHGYYINIELLFNWIKSRPNMKVIWTLHDCWAFTGHAAYCDAVNCNRWQKKCHDCPNKSEYPKSFVDRSSDNWIKKKRIFNGIKNLTIVTPSYWLAGLVKKSFLFQYDAKVIYNGIDLDVFKPTPSGFRKKYHIENKKMLLGVASTWSERKGLKDFLKLSNEVDDKYRIVLVGLKQDQISSSYSKILCIANTNNPDELAAIYSAADIFINPSVEETMGLVTVEALACGTPVITYNKTAVPEVVSESCGYIVAPSYKNIIPLLSKVNFDEENCVMQARKFEKIKQYNVYLALYYELFKR